MKNLSELNFTGTKEKFFKFFKGSWSIILIALAITLGYWGRGFIENQKKATVTEMHPTRTIDETSVAVNERDELIIFNRETGSYEIYAKEVRMAIFNQQFSKIQTDFKAKK